MCKHQKSYEELTFADDFMFCKIMQNNERICKKLLEMIVKKPIRKIQFPEKQKEIEIIPEAKGVRLDIYVEDEMNSVYDVEMQTTEKLNLPKRSRYYQGMIDLNLIERGADYNELKKSYVIFICTFDYFKKGLHIYTFDNECVELPGLKLGDEAIKVFLCANGIADDVTEEMKNFLRYLSTGMAQDDFTREIADEISKARKHEKWRVEYMTILMRDHDKFNEGKEAGEKIKLVELIRKKRNKGICAEDCADMVEEDVTFVRNAYDIMKNHPLMDDGEVFKILEEMAR